MMTWTFENTPQYFKMCENRPLNGDAYSILIQYVDSSATLLYWQNFIQEKHKNQFIMKNNVSMILTSHKVLGPFLRHQQDRASVQQLKLEMSQAVKETYRIHQSHIIFICGHHLLPLCQNKINFNRAAFTPELLWPHNKPLNITDSNLPKSITFLLLLYPCFLTFLAKHFLVSNDFFKDRGKINEHKWIF